MSWWAARKCKKPCFPSLSARADPFAGFTTCKQGG